MAIGPRPAGLARKSPMQGGFVLRPDKRVGSTRFSGTWEARTSSFSSFRLLTDEETTLATTEATLLPPATAGASLIRRSTTIGRSFSFSVTVPSFASVYNEYALKSQYDTSIHL
ncbi:hypothetical protein IGI04_007347 [Brassica rapa subsp. trilocularis]|uniref:Uncharacterized protein n=1 Tax=Brassica rapa subsp. trilocularis TaxID=1813537 RepID=A0ABQ7NJ89_BRACM|nr:hypothetical protein IGI04_007275 [Brassica rapa subsp. trilocularis]KAG5411028.1 hypothetical protein IGI04_007347 [Brassica rapa subsp. trilocularis]